MKKNNCPSMLSSRELCKLLGQKIRVNTGGPESRVGRLVCVGEDFLAIESFDKHGKGKGGKGKGKDGKRRHGDKDLIFYQLRHVKAIVLEADEICCWNNSKKCTKDTFCNVLCHFINHKVKINRGGPYSVEGVLVAVNRSTIELIRGDEIIFITIKHIKSFSQVGGCHDESSHKKESSNKKESSHKKESSSKKESSRKKESSCCKESSSSSSSWCESSSHKKESSHKKCESSSSSSHHWKKRKKKTRM